MSYIQIAKDDSIKWIPVPVTDDTTKSDDESFVYDVAITLVVKNYMEALNMN